MATEWCVCSDLNSGHHNLAPVAEDVFVHGACGKPSFEWWQAFEDYCEECGCSFSSQVDKLCPQCGGRSWADVLADHDAQILARKQTETLDPP